jgi:hypothetical protein
MVYIAGIRGCNYLDWIVVYGGNIGEYNEVNGYEKFGLIETRKGIRRPAFEGRM